MELTLRGGRESGRTPVHRKFTSRHQSCITARSTAAQPDHRKAVPVISKTLKEVRGDAHTYHTFMNTRGGSTMEPRFRRSHRNPIPLSEVLFSDRRAPSRRRVRRALDIHVDHCLR